MQAFLFTAVRHAPSAHDSASWALIGRSGHVTPLWPFSAQPISALCVCVCVCVCVWQDREEVCRAFSKKQGFVGSWKLKQMSFPFISVHLLCLCIKYPPFIWKAIIEPDGLVMIY